jgi:hypothetical protein
MPTGYTADVADGKVTELEDYILDVSRGMGFAIHLRDSGIKGKIPYDTERSYYKEDYEKAVKKLDDWNNKSEIDKRVQFEKEMHEERNRLNGYLSEKRKTKANYENMIAKVEAWEVPEFLESTKEFALSQLKESVTFDCAGDYYERSKEEAENRRYEDWVAGKESSLFSDVEYSLNRWKEEKHRVAERNRYIKALYDSLGLETP